MSDGTASADPVVEEDAFEAARNAVGAPFLASFPRDAELDLIVTAFMVGNYARVRAEGSRLARRTEDDDVRAAARELVRRTEPDPLAKWFMIGAAGLLAFLALWFWSHGHGSL